MQLAITKEKNRGNIKECLSSALYNYMFEGGEPIFHIHTICEKEKANQQEYKYLRLAMDKYFIFNKQFVHEDYYNNRPIIAVKAATVSDLEGIRLIVKSSINNLEKEIFKLCVVL